MGSQIKCILRKVALASIGIGASLIASDITTTYLYFQEDPDIEEYVQENLELFIEKQEKELGISYSAKRPSIEYLIPKENIPLGVIGLYDNANDTIYLPSGLLIRPRWDFNDTMVTIVTFNRTAYAKRVLDHELAHFYCDKVKEQVLGKNHHLSNIYMFIPEERIANQLVGEGIAKYIENKMNGEDHGLYPFKDWPSDIEDFSNKEIYQGGYTIVRPIIDQYKEKGIHILLLNLPTEEEIFKPLDYQKRIFRKLAELP